MTILKIPVPEIAVRCTSATGSRVMLTQASYALGYSETSQRSPPRLSRKYSYSVWISCPVINQPRREVSSSSAAPAHRMPSSSVPTA